MRLNRLALALVAVSSSWVVLANPASSSNVGGAIAGTVGASALGATAATQRVAGQNQARFDSRLGPSPGANLNAGNPHARLNTQLTANHFSAKTNHFSANLDAGWSAGPGAELRRGEARSNSRSSLTGGAIAGTSLSGSAPHARSMDESIPRGWLMALVAVLLIGHQLRRKHRFLRPHRFSDL